MVKLMSYQLLPCHAHHFVICKQRWTLSVRNWRWSSADIRHAAKLSNFLTSPCCTTKLPRIDMVSIQQISCASCQKLGNL